MIKSYVRKTVIVEEEDQFGKVTRVENQDGSEEELDLLRNYAKSRRCLPIEPFSGRVKAAINSFKEKEEGPIVIHLRTDTHVMMHDP